MRPSSRMFVVAVYVKNIHKHNDQVILAYVPELNELLQSTSWEPYDRFGSMFTWMPIFIEVCWHIGGEAGAVYKFERTVLESALQSEEKRIHEDLEKFATKLKEYKIGGKVRSIVAKNAGEGIVKAIEEENADLAVVGCRGMGKIRRTFMGSVSDYVVHHSHVPVLVVRHDDDKHHKDKHHDKHKDNHKEDKHKEDKHKDDKHKDTKKDDKNDKHKD
ncbi:hypothetical protein LOTGIDRAFT_164562 [Lottia gigantea]|uniref:UspA domain-containing protein n=1 Tax=Lottia gigantea TaxID=225164 RepID=V4BM03_LOTGI|nr:hypothetical protein LOTGIDRAFT_164562 [Lottia gigantea]ESO89874.1 hypothetical protein LOTGIDRAFT_164562 [Lottia gigantea]